MINIKLAVTFILFSYQLTSFAVPNCNTQLNHFLDTEKLSYKVPKYFGIKNWFKISESEFQTFKFRRPLASSNWIDVTVNQSCKILKSEIISEIKNETNATDAFSDEELFKLSKKNKITLVYIWSPSMIYSMQEISVAKKIAHELKIDFLPLYANKYKIQNTDQRKLADIGLTHSILKQSRPLNSNYLKFSHQINHYPLMFIVGKNKISKKVIAGVFPETIWRQELKSWSQNY